MVTDSSDGVACHAVVPAAGIGARMGADCPKQYLQIKGITILEYSVRALLACPHITSVVVALHADDRQAQTLAILNDPRVEKVHGGEQRSDSVLAALNTLESSARPGDWVLVHDAARPCLLSGDVAKLIQAVTTQDVGGILAEPLMDTVKRADGEARVTATLDRSTLWRAQTPQMFKLGELQGALRTAAEQGLVVTDEASAMELQGYPVQLVSGSPSNLKVTVAQDLALAGWYLAQPDHQNPL